MAGTWVALKNQPSFAANAMMLLTDGTVMAQESGSANWWKLSPDSNGSYVNGAWTSRATGPNGPLYYASAVLMDGRVLIAGGEDNFNNESVELDAAQIYDPVADARGQPAWTMIPTPGWGWIGDAPACLLPDGTLIMGSIKDKRTAIYDPTANKWTPGPDKDDTSSEETWTLLPDGSVLTAEVTNHPKAERYVPSQKRWISAGSVPEAADLIYTSAAIGGSEIGPAILMNDGRVFAIGASGHTAIYNSATGTWAPGPDIKDSTGDLFQAIDAPAVLLPNGRVLCIVGKTGGGTLPAWAGYPAKAFEFDGTKPIETALTPVPDPPNATDAYTYECQLLLLPTGEVLCSTDSSDMQVYQPDGAPNPAWAPSFLAPPATIYPGHSFWLEGTQLNGLSQANSYGDDAQMATNFPIVRISTPSGQVFYCRTYNFSTMGVATGMNPQYAQVDVPMNVPIGMAQLCVIANGIASCVTVAVSNSVFKHGIMDKVSKTEKVEAKENKEAKEGKEHKDLKGEFKESDDFTKARDLTRQLKEAKEAKELKEAKETKELKETKNEKLENIEFMEHKHVLDQSKTILEGKQKDSETIGGSTPASLSAIADALNLQAEQLRAFIRRSERPAVGEDALRSSASKKGKSGKRRR
ncbi:MAG TPA: hypothetical protein VGU20_00310 [Stellaceae bacterium]|nr:hypothetical protein [Stellaceae bacterium]